MAKKRGTVFQALDKAITGNWNPQDTAMPHINTYDMSSSGKDVLYKTSDKEDYLNKKLELQQNKYLKDRWVKANVNLSVTAYAGLNNVKLMYRDADLMDAFPEIGAALDLYAEEACLHGSTKIKLLNGKTKTIEELYNEKCENFWVYAVDKDGKFSPSKVERVINKGKKELYKVTLDDGTEIKCTDNHMWLLSSNQWAETKDLKGGDSLMSLYENLNYKGYERIKSTVENKYRMTHRVVAETVLSEERERVVNRNVPHQLVVIHHKSFNKLNNDPNELQYMLWNEHEKLHSDMNKERWKNEDFSVKMRKIFSDTAKKMWSERKDELKSIFKKSKQKYFASLTKEELVEKYGRNGEKNGMYGVHRYGKLNPNYNSNVNHICDINEKEYVDYIVSNNARRKDLSKHFNLLYHDVADYNSMLCKKYNVKTIDSLKYLELTKKAKKIIDDSIKSNKKISLDNLSQTLGTSEYVTRKLLKKNNILIGAKNIDIFLEKEFLDNICEFLSSMKTLDYITPIRKKYGLSKKKVLKIQKEICKIYNISNIKDLKYVYKKGEKLTTLKNLLKNNLNISKEEVATKLNFSGHELLKFSKKCGYKTYKDLKDSLYNHRVVSVEKLTICDTVYDLFNSSCNSCFGVKCNDGQIISHNCISNDEGNVVSVYSKSDRIKSILQDLFVNRLNIQLTAPMIIRAMCKYGNQFMLLDIDNKNGVKGWKQMPVFNVERIENGIQNPYGMGMSIAVNGITKNDADLSTQFVWLDDNNSQVPFRDWQIAHFRLLTNSLYLPYGVSALNAARRHWRMLSLMEDMMLIYRLERSVERRVYKIFVGAIDDADVQAYVEQIANQFKRTPIVDPMTGQIDLRKNILPVHKDTPIPLLDGRTITIENLAKEFESGKENYVYSIQDKTHKIVAGKVVWCGKNYTAEKLYKIVLDDDSYMVLAGEHEIIMRDGSKKRADEVSIGESVMPLYKKVDKNSKKLFDRYEKVYNPNSGKYEFTHRIIASEIEKNNDSYNTVHHKDFNKYNNNPSNLVWMDYHEHHKMHGDLARANWNDPIKRKKHKIKNIEIVGGDDVYCMTVVGLNGEDDRHNFALTTWKTDGSLNESGVFVSNCIDNDVFLPVRDENAPTPIDTLSAGQNLTAMDDIKFVQNKVLTALRIPKSFLNFEENAGDGKNLALMDIRFTRLINRIQQAFLMELTKVASIHLFLLGFNDELNNFTLSMNNPSTQAEGLEIENMQKKIDAVRDAVSDPGNGLPVMSQTRALKQIMKWSEKEIKENLEEIRLEKGIAAELEKTTQIIKKTGIFDTVDRIYGEPGAEYMDDQQGQGGMGNDGGMGGGGAPPPAPMGGEGDMGGDLDGLGAPGDDGSGGDIAGAEGSMPTADMGSDPNAPMESIGKNKPLINENKIFNEYINMLNGNKSKVNEASYKRAEIYDSESLLVNEEFDKMIKALGKFVDEK